MATHSWKPLLVSLGGAAFFTSIVFASAGRSDYPQGWAYAALSVALAVAQRLILRGDEALARERARPGEGAEAWDKRLLGLGLLLNVATLVVAGLDSGRFHPPSSSSWPWTLAGLLVSLVGTSVFLLAMRENRHFSAVVRVQRDRGHIVCTTGPYRVVRHPGNAGMIVGTLGFPLLFASPWCAIPAALSALVLVARTAREDRLLADELDGYREYQSATRYRLLPGVW
jgi:protein-S-isoprenylcysteine O-methyltransferase Ste14